MVSKNRQKIGEANGMLNLPTVDSLDAPTAALYSHLALEIRIMQ